MRNITIVKILLDNWDYPGQLKSFELSETSVWQKGTKIAT